MAFPGQLKVDYVRVYQDASTAMSADNSTMVCSPPNMPTEEYIKAHAGDYAGAPKPTPLFGRACDEFWKEMLRIVFGVWWQGRRSRR